ncbi:MAG TPA: hypothetical protein DCR24_06010 [Bacillus bacterium]|nr:hypothetical protein [Bacillus sp. (in: firmicutes)]
MMVMNILTDLKTSYGGYPVIFNVYSGWLVAIGAIALGFVFTYVKKWDKTASEIPQNKGVSK